MSRVHGIIGVFIKTDFELILQILYRSSHLSHVLLLDGLKEVVPVRAAGLGARLQPGYKVRLSPLVHQVERQVQHHSLEVCRRENSLGNV